jgi:glycosyltransferase involved in cell wall biosynthesis
MEKKVCMIVFNHFKNDARVLKEAYTLMDNGFKVKVFALYDPSVDFHENRKGLEIERIQIDPIHQRFLKKKKSTPTKTSGTNKSSETPPAQSAKPSSPEKTATQKKSFKESSFYIGFYKFITSIILAFHKPLTYYDFQKRVVKRILESPFDIYHAHDLNTLYPAFRGAKITGGKLIYDSHELYIERNKPKKPSAFYKYLSSIFEKKYIRKADAVITVGDCIAQHLKDKYHIELPTVIMNAPSKQKVNIDGKSLRSELKISQELKLAVYCGGITFNRGLEKLIESLTLMPNVYLVLMGYGKPDYLNKLQSIANQHNVNDRFSFYGPVAPTEVTAYTASADIGVAPIENVCLSYYYCAPNKIFEYLIGGIPVVASNFPELEKIVQENEIGATFNPEDIKSIASSINTIISDDKMYQKMKENTRFAADKYNWENESVKLLKLYNSL